MEWDNHWVETWNIHWHNAAYSPSLQSRIGEFKRTVDAALLNAYDILFRAPHDVGTPEIYAQYEQAVADYLAHSERVVGGMF